MSDDSARTALLSLYGYASTRDYVGPDPYDALNGPVGGLVRRRHSRQVVIQLVRRAPLDMRPLLRVRPVRMAKALALFCSGLTRATWLPNAPTEVDRLTTELAQSSNPAWGYEFDVQTRWGFYPAHSPNIIATSFVIEALNDAGGLHATRELREWLERSMLSPRGFVRYVPGNDRLIHNANILGARALFRLAPDHPAIPHAVHRTLDGQRPDGLWPYGDGAGLEWIDNFHSAYVLLGLRDLVVAVPDAQDALHAGLLAWLERCFEPDGTPRYYADRLGRRDVHNVATALHCLSVFSTDDQANALFPGALSHLLQMQRSDGAFVARSREPAYMRWNQGHAFRALADVCEPDS